jgi:ferredoxin
MDLESAVEPAIRGPRATPVALTVNGETQIVELEPRTSLLDALREHLRLTGSKKGCDQGTCGTCTVWVDGRMTSSERPEAGETYGELLARNHLADAEAMGSWRPPAFDAPHGLLTCGAQFAEVASGRSARPRRSRRRCSTPPGAGFASCRWCPSS